MPVVEGPDDGGGAGGGEQEEQGQQAVDEEEIGALGRQLIFWAGFGVSPAPAFPGPQKLGTGGTRVCAFPGLRIQTWGTGLDGARVFLRWSVVTHI
jgi:hypothetical protein